MQFYICNFIILDQRIKNDIKIIDKNLKFIQSFTLLFIFLEALLRSFEPISQRYPQSVPSSKNSWAIYFLLANHFAH